ncbi:TadE/TadG family type IV pilus assembly protein [Rugamonas apoptosis]|uniref:Pilus assembly protein n=1 Tax=Rugamonas apoptosis TaxID=2758570 RepID=A0A7W2IJE2_9BURK|nr:TadE/TadG family type IV pilus assembly protein [Rugamonas apoptosis]MBA5686222.1 pilus assembly protein [Rugamonas apoptosis]
MNTSAALRHRHADRPRARQGGATAVEFAIVASVFLMLMIGMMEMGRMLYYWNTATEATRLGARVAAVCDVNDSIIKTKMHAMLDVLPTSAITVSYTPSLCTVETCRYVTVSINSGVPIATYIPFVPLALSLPALSTTLPRESMLSTVGGSANPMCQ